MIRVPWKLVLLRPMNALRLFWSIILTFALGTTRLIRYSSQWRRYPRIWWYCSPRWAFSWSRHDSPKPVWCISCGWIGPLSRTYHGYIAIGDEDVEVQDFCPRCDSETIEPAAFVRGGVWSS